MAQQKLTAAIVEECKVKLLQAKLNLLNLGRSAKSDFESLDLRSGDEADQTMNLLAENEFLTSQHRLKAQLLEIEFALARIEQGRYGVCEETEEPIEIERLKVLPWTRVSIDGAQIRESAKRKLLR